MAQLTETKAERLPTSQATELLRVLELQAVWNNHLDGPTKSAGTNADLNIRRKAYDAFQTANSAYAARYGNGQLPEPTQVMPDRMAIWCRILRAVCQRAEGVNPVQLMAKVYRLADRGAKRLSKEPVGRGPLENMAGVLGELGVVIAWCDLLAYPRPLGKSNVGEAA